MTAYYLPSVLTGETVMLVSNPVTKEYLPAETENLGCMGFKKAFLDGVPVPLSFNGPINANRLYFQLYLNTKQQKWLDKIDTGKLFVPVALPRRQEARSGSTAADTQPRKLYRKSGNGFRVVAFLSPEDFERFDAEGRYKEYRLVHSDRTEQYIVNGILLDVH